MAVGDRIVGLGIWDEPLAGWKWLKEISVQ